MISGTHNARAAAKAILKTVGLLPTARRVSRAFSAPQKYREYERRFRRLKRRHSHVLGKRLNNPQQRQKVALVVSPWFPEVEMELGLVKALQLANFLPVVIIPEGGLYGELLAEHYKLAAVDEIHYWSEFTPEADSMGAEEIISQCGSIENLLQYEQNGIRVGKLAVSSALRRKYQGFLDLNASQDRDLLINTLGYAIASGKAAQNLVQRFRPDLALFVDTAYSPTGELCDYCMNNRLDVMQWQQGHKSNALLFKRLSVETKNQHPRSLSDDSWRLICDMEWTEGDRKQLDEELYRNYVSGDWYSVGGQPFNRSIVDPAELRERLKLDPNKKTAFIFPHVLWDATLFWGECLFRDYEEWFVETVRAACENDHVNWVVKVHPGNRRLRESGSLAVEPGELVSLRKYIGHLPPHIVLIPPDSDISTYSLFQIMDYCLTVRGTVGMEAARLGIPVLTGGDGPYHKRGFTLDASSREKYLEMLRIIQAIPKLSSAQTELANRFAYAMFLMRTWHAKSVTLRYVPNAEKFLSEGHVNIKSAREWHSAEDLKALAQWITDPSKPREFLNKVPHACRISG